ncbi:AAA family ATPase [Mycobacterium deserti]|uniref:LuxR C-terminal-related transcriptional regulator n=1 Tax=Mycobacterium deserti TaxID=2978347 RepID=A0ABT2MAT2_9MYCO|nr:LuxR family transcriptional regulator [Mycobacterium deserti]MCT7658689.1 LuxR C-terminal-related transcriptional regulator [Mycobacterium deserti]
MPTSAVGGLADKQAIADFLAEADADPTALLLEGEPGIGKTSHWLTGLEQAQERGYRVLSATPSAAESVLAYAGLADLLSDVESSTLSSLPSPQRIALDRVLLRVEADGEATDQRAVAAGFLSVVVALADQAPVLLAVDDLHWLDPSSVHVLAYAARRLPPRAGVLASVRSDPGTASGATWLRLPRPDAIRRVQVCPLSLGGLHAVLRERLGRSLSRPELVRIHQISGGNPFYAVELGREMDNAATGAEMKLPGTLAELVRVKVGRLDTELRDALLAVACLAAPTIELIAGAIGADAREVVPLLENAAASGIVVIDGRRVLFAHPLVAHGVYTDAAPARRRQMHRRLAELVDQPELRARHLALAATTGDSDTLDALDAAAEIARIRGAPAAAAELLDLAIGLGGDTPERRIRLAAHHFNSGDPGHARALLEQVIAQPSHGVLNAEAAHLLAYVRLLDDSFSEAARVLERGLGEAADDMKLRVRMLVTLSFALFNSGRSDAAVQKVEEAVIAAERLGQPDLLSRALGMSVILRFMRGDGLDQLSMQRATELETHEADIPIALRPSTQQALLLAWTGQLEQAYGEITAIRRRCIERGEDGELMFVTFHKAVIAIWRGDFADAALAVEDAVERAVQLDGDVPLSVALSNRALLSAYTGQVDEVRRDVSAARAASQRCHSDRLGEWPMTALGFLEVSLGNYEAALAALEPLLQKLNAALDATEIISATFVPDAVEAMVALGRLADAEPLIDALERNGRRLDRAWMLAVASRCRAMLMAAHGDVDAASLTVQQAMVEHDRLPMPFERARTQLLHGQLQRRQRRKDASATTVREALATFEFLRTPLWAERARAELARANIGPRRANTLTPSEQRVAELAASGMTNREVAGELFISPKTVEGALARIYHKLEIHSRAELGQRMNQPAG